MMNGKFPLKNNMHSNYVKYVLKSLKNNELNTLKYILSRV